MAANDHLASAETSELLSSSPSDDEAVSLTCISISTDVVHYRKRHSVVSQADRILHDVYLTAASCAAAATQTARPGPRYLLFTEGDVQVCRCSPKSAYVKFLKSHCMRYWENQCLILGSSEMSFHLQYGGIAQRIPYNAIEEIATVANWDSTGNRFCFRISISDCVLLIQTTAIASRDRLLHSIHWKRCISKFYHMFQQSSKCRSFIVYHFKEMIDLAVSSPILDDSILEFPLDVLSGVLDEGIMFSDRQSIREMFTAISPLLESCAPTRQVFDFFSKYSSREDLAEFVIETFEPVIYKILKHNLDIGRQGKRRLFVQEYIDALMNQKRGCQLVWDFIKRLHGSVSRCPHLRILPNLVSVCLAAIHGHYEGKRYRNCPSSCAVGDRLANAHILEEKLITYLTILQITCEYYDWLPHLAALLQPVPFPLVALRDDVFLNNFTRILVSISDNDRCEVHTAVLRVREDREGWFDLFCPGIGLAGRDDGHLYSVMLRRLIGCCCRRKQFLESRLKMLGAWCLLAERGDRSAIEALVALLEYEIFDGPDGTATKNRIYEALRSTDFGQMACSSLHQRQARLQEIQKKIGPTQLTLPSKSTDLDLSKVLSSGSFGNLESLTLSFTHITSACAHDLIKLRSLRQLNLWSTQFSDTGLELLTEHLHQLQVLNLCETPVTDKGLRCLAALKSLRKLNLNSTQLSAQTFEKLKENLPLLQEYDICYTDAW